MATINSKSKNKKSSSNSKIAYYNNNSYNSHNSHNNFYGRGCYLALFLAFFIFISIFVSLLFPKNIAAQFPPQYREAIQLYTAARYQFSLETIRSIFDDNSRSLELRLLAAANYKMLRQYNLARAHLDIAMKEHRQRFEPYALRAAMESMQGKQWSAISTAQAGIQISKRNPNLYLQIGAAYYKMNNFPRARFHLQKVLQFQPNNFYATYLEGLIFLKEGRYELAEFRLRNALDLEIRDKNDLADLYNNLGVTLERKAWQYHKANKIREANVSFEDALRYYNFALTIEPNEIKARNNQRRLQAR